MQRVELLIIGIFTGLAVLGIGTAIMVHHHPPACQPNADAKFSKGYWYCVPHGQEKWGPMGR